MGSPDSEAGRDRDEGPLHQVTISEGFFLTRYEITQAQWKIVMGENPSLFPGEDRPVENVSWHDVQDFIKRLNDAKDGFRYRLPTEAEWEFAARARNEGPYPGELAALAWFEENSRNQTHPVGQKQPNAWGMYDMHGNVWEWCEDWYEGNYYAVSTLRDPTGPKSGSLRVIRGGSYFYPAANLRSANRDFDAPERRDGYLGFRLVRTQLR